MQLNLRKAVTIQAIGILWQIIRTVRTSTTNEELYKMLRRSILREAFLKGCQLDEHGNMPYTIMMPCGDSITYPDIDDIPMKDVPCSCGDPTHWFVKFADEWRDRN